MMKRLLVIITLITSGLFSTTILAEDMELWFSPGWKTKVGQAKKITKALSDESGVTITPRIAKSYPEILDEFNSGKPALVYVGSFVQAIIRARNLGEGLVQSVTGKEMYSGVLVYPEGEDPADILSKHPEEIAYAVGASSGESSARAATGGKASIKTKNHVATVGAVKSGYAKAGVVKNWWWEANSNRYKGIAVYKIPGISETKNPDNVLAASKGVSDADKKKVKAAAIKLKGVFGAKSMRDFDPSTLDFSLSLMAKGKIDPATYSW